LSQPKKTDARDLQRRVLNGDLYQEVLATEQALRHRSEYDVGTAEERRFAILCWALEQSANGTIGTSLTLYGAQRALERLREEVEGVAGA
jgi:hypothetical protein